MIEGGTTPVNRAVAERAVGWKTRRRMVWVRSPVIVLHVAVRACPTRQTVVAANVTLDARSRQVGASQRESGDRVVPGAASPRRGVVALLAGLRETGLHVIGIRGALEILEVACYTR